MKSREILKIGIRSLVEVYEEQQDETEVIHKYVVCSYYDSSKEYGEQWCWGHCFDVWNPSEKENKLKAAMNYILDNERTTEEITRVIETLNEKSKILYELDNQDKISEDSKGIIDGLDTAINILNWCTDSKMDLENVFLVGRFDEWKVKELDSVINIYGRE